MAGSLLILMRYVLLFLVFKASTSLNQKEQATGCNFGITKITTYNMETKIYWKSNFSHEDTAIQYVANYTCEDNWVSVPCARSQWHKNSSEMSCVVLTCSTTPLDEYCELRIEAHGNSSRIYTTPSALYNPTSENIPPRITDVKIINDSPSSALISWEFPADFCPRSKYCMEFKYHEHGAKRNKTVSVPFPNMNSTSVAGLDFCSKYLFYLIAYEDELCSISIAARWTTGPFVLPSQAIDSNSLGVRVLNFNTTIFWRQADFCSLKSTQFSVYYKESYESEDWKRYNCMIKNDTSKLFSCEFLTCAVIEDRGYDVEIRIDGSDGQLKNSLYFLPSLENIPDQIKHVSIVALTSKSLQVTWKLSSSFCLKFPYCLKFFMSHGDSENKSLEVNKNEQSQMSTIVDNLQPYTQYFFYAVTFRPGLGCFYHPKSSHGATGPFTGLTLEEAPSSAPVLICGLCDVVVDGRTRYGIVRWQLPPKAKWNGLPRLFLIQWREKTDQNISEPVWNNKTIFKRRAIEGTISGLLTSVEYIVRVKMCNGEKLCSKFSKEMLIDILMKEEVKKVSSQSRIVAISVGVTVPVLIVILLGILLLVYFKRKINNLRNMAIQLPNLECSSYENVSLPSNKQPYSKLPSPTDECYPVESSDQPDQTSGSTSPADEKTTTSKTETEL